MQTWASQVSCLLVPVPATGLPLHGLPLGMAGPEWGTDRHQAPACFIYCNTRGMTIFQTGIEVSMPVSAR